MTRIEKMEYLVEGAGVHCASDLLRELREELARLGEAPSVTPSTRSELDYHRPPTVREVVSAAPHVRIDGELFATRLEIEREEAEQALCEQIARERAAVISMWEALDVEFIDGRLTIEAEFEAAIDDVRSEYEVASRVMDAKLRRLAVEQRRTDQALGMLEHTRMLEELDRDVFAADAIRMKRLHRDNEVKRRKAEEVERVYMNSIKLELAPDGTALKNVPFLLTSFERHL